MFDAYVTNPEIGTYPVETLQVPTLLVHATDDPLASHQARPTPPPGSPQPRWSASTPAATSKLGQTERVRPEVAAFLSTPTHNSQQG